MAPGENDFDTPGLDIVDIICEEQSSVIMLTNIFAFPSRIGLILSIPLNLVVFMLFALAKEMCDVHHVKTTAFENQYMNCDGPLFMLW